VIRADRHQKEVLMNLTRLPHHEHPAPPYHELRQKTVFDSRSRNIGQVENLYVDDDRNLQFFDVVTCGVLGLRKKHHLVPAEAIAEEFPGDITLRVNHKRQRKMLHRPQTHTPGLTTSSSAPPASTTATVRKRPYGKSANFAQHC
jgi:hypothetical protein